MSSTVSLISSHLLKKTVSFRKSTPNTRKFPNHISVSGQWVAHDPSGPDIKPSDSQRSGLRPDSTGEAHRSSTDITRPKPGVSGPTDGVAAASGSSSTSSPPGPEVAGDYSAEAAGGGAAASAGSGDPASCIGLLSWVIGFSWGRGRVVHAWVYVNGFGSCPPVWYSCAVGFFSSLCN